MSGKKVRLVTSTVQVILYRLGHSMEFHANHVWGWRINKLHWLYEGQCNTCRIVSTLSLENTYEETLWELRIARQLFAYIDQAGNEIVDKRAIPVSSWCTKYRNMK